MKESSVMIALKRSGRVGHIGHSAHKREAETRYRPDFRFALLHPAIPISIHLISRN